MNVKTPKQIATETAIDVTDAVQALKPAYWHDHITILVAKAILEGTQALREEREKLIKENEALACYVGNQKFTSDFKTADEMRLALNKARAEAAGLQAVLDDC